jgi:hypothetical protein
VETQPSADEVRSLLRRAAAIADFEDDGRWAIIRELHRRTDRAAFDAACALAGSADLLERIVALDVLAQIGYSAGRPFLEQTLPVLIEASGHGDADVVAAAVTALGQLWDPRALPAILRQAGHPSADVRYSVAFAIPGAAPQTRGPAARRAAPVRPRRRPPRVRDRAGLRPAICCQASPPVRQSMLRRADDGASVQHDRRCVDAHARPLEHELE